MINSAREGFGAFPSQVGGPSPSDKRQEEKVALHCDGSDKLVAGCWRADLESWETVRIEFSVRDCGYKIPSIMTSIPLCYIIRIDHNV